MVLELKKQPNLNLGPCRTDRSEILAVSLLAVTGLDFQGRAISLQIFDICVIYQTIALKAFS